MFEILSREQLTNMKNAKSNDYECPECGEDFDCLTCTIPLVDTALYWQDKAERQAAALEQAKIALHTVVDDAVYSYKDVSESVFNTVDAAIKAIEGVSKG